tara:strand:- start:1357 stop:1548 length:192 start_codon:yes stop_codon:yes gene_type:complete
LKLQLSRYSILAILFFEKLYLHSVVNELWDGALNSGAKNALCFGVIVESQENKTKKIQKILIF